MIFAALAVLLIVSREVVSSEWSSSSNLYDLPEPTHEFEVHTAPKSAHGRRNLRTELAPLFLGYGTHYVYAYVGTPPQRQSLIIDTGSHITAFPCTGCKQCGDHTDSYFEPEKSKTAQIPHCLSPNNRCSVSQSYSEGSSWKGYKVQDQVYLSAEASDMVPQAASWAVNFTFACQTEESGLFRSQLADGILGLSASDDTLPSQLLRQHVTESKVFALCLRTGGGILTLGGVNQRLHSRHGRLQFAALQTSADGLYTVQMKDIRIRSSKGTIYPLYPGSTTGTRRRLSDKKSVRGFAKPPKASSNTSAPVKSPAKAPASTPATGPAPPPAISLPPITFPASRVNKLGVVVDSGTTDTYLPGFLGPAFRAAFSQATQQKVQFSAGNFRLKDLSVLPDLLFDFVPWSPPVNGSVNASSTTNSSTEVVTVTLAPAAYLDALGGDEYTFRLYFSDPAASSSKNTNNNKNIVNSNNNVLLGANFWSNLNVIFDGGRGRLGLSPSTCNYIDFAPKLPAPSLSPSPSSPDQSADPQSYCDRNKLVPYTQCTATCSDEDTDAYTAKGEQNYVNECDYFTYILGTSSNDNNDNNNNNNNDSGNNNDNADNAYGSYTDDFDDRRSRRLEEAFKVVTRPCFENCTRSTAVRGDPRCPDGLWSECSTSCIMTRKAVPLDLDLDYYWAHPQNLDKEKEKLRQEQLAEEMAEGVLGRRQLGSSSSKKKPKNPDSGSSPQKVCPYREQTAACYTGQCPRQTGDYLIFVDFHLRISPRLWGSVHAESLALALQKHFGDRLIKSPYAIEVLHNPAHINNNNRNDNKESVRVHVQIRLKRRDFSSEQLLHAAAETVVQRLRSSGFASGFLGVLDAVSTQQDRGSQRRFGWLYPEDLKVLSAVAMPIAPDSQTHRTPDNAESGSDDDQSLVQLSSGAVERLLLLGGVVALVSVCACLLLMHCRLREEYLLLSKDKSALRRSSSSLQRVWARIAQFAALQQEREREAGGASGGNGHNHHLYGEDLSKQQRALELELSRRGLLSREEEDDEEEG